MNFVGRPLDLHIAAAKGGLAPSPSYGLPWQNSVAGDGACPRFATGRG